MLKKIILVMTAIDMEMLKHLDFMTIMMVISLLGYGYILTLKTDI